MKRKKPKFLAQDYFRYRRLGTRWRRPKGLQSKMRVGKGGSGYMPSPGYGSDRAIKNRIKIGEQFLMPVYVTNEDDLKNAEKRNDAIAVISSGVGLKKAKALADKAHEMNIKILNKRRIKKAVKLQKLFAKKKETEKKEHEKTEKKEIKASKPEKPAAAEDATGHAVSGE